MKKKIGMLLIACFCCDLNADITVSSKNTGTLNPDSMATLHYTLKNVGSKSIEVKIIVDRHINGRSVKESDAECNVFAPFPTIRLNSGESWDAPLKLIGTDSKKEIYLIRFISSDGSVHSEFLTIGNQARDNDSNQQNEKKSQNSQSKTLSPER